MRALDKGRIVKLLVDHEGGGPQAGTICRVVHASPSSDRYMAVAVQAQPGAKTPTGAQFVGHTVDGSVRTRGWWVPRYKLAPQRATVKSAREFIQRYRLV